MKNKYDILIAGAGPVGCVIAERCARILNWKVLLIDKRNHVAGNCYDEIHDAGVLIHKYGPHYFRTNSDDLLEYLSEFTEWIPGNYIVKSSARGELFPFPINLLTLSQFFGEELDAEAAQQKLEEVREKIDDPQNSEEFVLSRVGREMYETFYLGYTLKQWDKHPRDLNKSVCGRIPVRLNKDCRYVDHKHQVTPKEGFTELFKNMIDHPNIEVRLETDFQDIRNEITPNKATVYCGPVDEYFDCKLGKLAWRSLEFDFVEYKEEYKQPCVQINYPNEHGYTRSVEIKHVTQQKTPNTVISYEYPRAKGDPYYPIPADENQELYLKYKEMADNEKEENKVYFCGRLATYRYINTDEVIEKALECFDEIKANHGS
jgi:UDP-galactopyranose mutase